MKTLKDLNIYEWQGKELINVETLRVLVVGFIKSELLDNELFCEYGLVGQRKRGLIEGLMRLFDLSENDLFGEVEE